MMAVTGSRMLGWQVIVDDIRDTKTERLNSSAGGDELTRWRPIEVFGGWSPGWYGRHDQSKSGGQPTGQRLIEVRGNPYPIPVVNIEDSIFRVAAVGNDRMRIVASCESSHLRVRLCSLAAVDQRRVIHYVRNHRIRRNRTSAWRLAP
jgi:hypothetical protein